MQAKRFCNMSFSQYLQAEIRAKMNKRNIWLLIAFLLVSERPPLRFGI